MDAIQDSEKLDIEDMLVRFLKSLRRLFPFVILLAVLLAALRLLFLLGSLLVDRHSVKSQLHLDLFTGTVHRQGNGIACGILLFHRIQILEGSHLVFIHLQNHIAHL